jgi:hypothetical protein
MEIEVTEARRKCGDCKTPIEKNEVAVVVWEENQFGKRKVSYCKVCSIKGLRIRKRNIDKLIKRIRGM